MSCSDSQDAVNNALHSCSNKDAVTLTVSYGPYMNWGRWNHNPRRVQTAIDALLKAGFNCQLRHDKKETSWEDHGEVKILYVNANKEDVCLASKDKAQHNMQWRDIPANMEKLVKDAIAKYTELNSKAANTAQEEEKQEESQKAATVADKQEESQKTAQETAEKEDSAADKEAANEDDKATQADTQPTAAPGNVNAAGDELKTQE